MSIACNELHWVREEAISCLVQASSHGLFTKVQNFSLCLCNPSHIGQRTSAYVVWRQLNEVECWGANLLLSLKQKAAKC